MMGQPFKQTENKVGANLQLHKCVWQSTHFETPLRVPDHINSCVTCVI